MIEPVARLAQAEIDAVVARERLSATIAALQMRLNPKRLARKAMREAADKGSVAAMAVRQVADKGSQAAAAGVDGARRNPGALAGVTALAGLFLARHRIVELARGRGNPKRQTKAEPAPLPERIST